MRLQHVENRLSTHSRKRFSAARRAMVICGVVGLFAACAAGITVLAAPSAVLPFAPVRSGTFAKETPANNPNYPFATDAMLSPGLAAAVHAEATERTQGYLRLTQEPGLASRRIVLPTQAPTIAPRGIANGTGNVEGLAPYLLQMDVTNHWEGIGSSSDPALVLAGALRSDPTQGVIMLLYGQRNSSYGGEKTFPTPTKHGAVRITAVNGSIFSLAAADGTTFTFDLKAMAYR